MGKGYQAKDIPTLEAMQVLLAKRYPRWQSLTEAFPDLPAKVCLAKYNQLLKAKLIDGCGCGCSTVAEITDKGKELYEDGIIGRVDQDRRNKKFKRDLSPQARNKHGILVCTLWI